MKCIILAGGIGNTLWPLSRKNYPKQFLNICEGRSLLQDTIVRNLPFADEFIIVTNESYKEIMESQLKAFQGLRYRIIYESRNCGTFAAVSLASAFLNASDIMMVTVSDLIIEDGSYKDSVIKAKEIAKNGAIANIVRDLSVDDVDDHAGIYICMVGTFNHSLQKIFPDVCQLKKKARRRLKTVRRNIVVPENIMEQFPHFRMQAELFARMDNVVPVEAHFNYKDVDDVYDVSELGTAVYEKNIISNNCEDVLLINTASKHLVVANSINDIAVVNTDDATYISDREHIDDIKAIAKEHIEEYKPYFESSKVMFRQWGMHEILSSTEHYKVKKVTIYPKMSMKLHKHEHRLESWTIVEGTATIQIGNEVKEYTKNDTVSVPIGVPHRVSNLTDYNVIIIETGIGEIMSEAEFEKKKDTDFVNIDEDSSLVSIPDIMRLEPAFKDNLWGGTKLRTVFGKKCDYDVIGESWELSAHPDGQSVIASGIFTGMYFGEFIEKYGHDVVGWKSSSLDRFPVLIKFIDAKKDLSIQIHPDDDYALEIENEFGKNEMWYVVDCEPGAYLYCGLKQDSSKEEIRERIENNTITDILNKIEVHKGDCVMVKAGTIHAIGAGILICEIQQNSNCTYRMYDYDRKDKFGNKRELHIDKAIDVVDVKKYKPFISDNKDVPEGAEVLVSCKYFECYKYVLGSDAAEADHASNMQDNCIYNTENVRNTGKVNISVDAMSFRSVIVIDGNGKIAVGNNTMDYKAGDSFFVTAGEKVINLEGTGTVIVTKV
ncbi:MAG TPA: mannose-1-phosphate guanylyltransferase [Eubacterium sp.]|nr:mannose-1-phosphate guanylyltransferase [Eubacterium sp.]